MVGEILLDVRDVVGVEPLPNLFGVEEPGRIALDSGKGSPAML